MQINLRTFSQFHWAGRTGTTKRVLSVVGICKVTQATCNTQLHLFNPKSTSSITCMVDKQTLKQELNFPHG